MVGFEYQYLSSREIIKNLKLLLEYSIIEYIILISLIIFFIITIYYIIPSINIFLKYRQEKKNKLMRKRFIKQIALQKDINDEIEKELNK